MALAGSPTRGGDRPADLARIFEPFYTKKVMGKSGTGLGMAVVWGTVKDHHGYIDIQAPSRRTGLHPVPAGFPKGSGRAPSPRPRPRTGPRASRSWSWTTSRAAPNRGRHARPAQLRGAHRGKRRRGHRIRRPHQVGSAGPGHDHGPGHRRVRDLQKDPGNTPGPESGHRQRLLGDRPGAESPDDGRRGVHQKAVHSGKNRHRRPKGTHSGTGLTRSTCRRIPLSRRSRALETVQWNSKGSTPSSPPPLPRTGRWIRGASTG